LAPNTEEGKNFLELDIPEGENDGTILPKLLALSAASVSTVDPKNLNTSIGQALHPSVHGEESICVDDG